MLLDFSTIKNYFKGEFKGNANWDKEATDKFYKWFNGNFKFWDWNIIPSTSNVELEKDVSNDWIHGQIDYLDTTNNIVYEAKERSNYTLDEWFILQALIYCRLVNSNEMRILIFNRKEEHNWFCYVINKNGSVSTYGSVEHKINLNNIIPKIKWAKYMLEIEIPNHLGELKNYKWNKKLEKGEICQ
jgi:hypothetical protein